MGAPHTTTALARRRRLPWHKRTMVADSRANSSNRRPARARMRTPRTARGQVSSRPASRWPARIVVRQSRHCGDATTTDTQSAMHVVRTIAISYLILIKISFRISGLYYKLHGIHRPSGMKKSEIKRRRRVMPATSDQHLAPFSVNHSQPITPSPEPGPPKSVPPFYVQQQPQQHSEHSHPHQLPLPVPSDHARQSRAPIAVDFTHFGKPSRPTSADQPGQASDQQNTRKRSFSISNASDQQHQPPSPAYPHSDRSNRSETENIDPSLSAPTTSGLDISAQEYKAPLASMGGTQSAQSSELSRQEKRARLEQEMAMMREALLAKEREMADLGE